MESNSQRGGEVWSCMSYRKKIELITRLRPVLFFLRLPVITSMVTRTGDQARVADACERCQSTHYRSVLSSFSSVSLSLYLCPNYPFFVHMGFWLKSLALEQAHFRRLVAKRQTITAQYKSTIPKAHRNEPARHMTRAVTTMLYSGVYINE